MTKPVRPKRRKRSYLNKDDCFTAMKRFAGRVHRWKESSAGFDQCDPPLSRGFITVTFLIEGSFGASDDLFEALRIAGGFKLPAER